MGEAAIGGSSEAKLRWIKILKNGEEQYGYVREKQRIFPAGVEYQQNS